MLWMQVRDDGGGSNDLATKGQGIGMQQVRERLANFYPDRYEFDAVVPAGAGYEVTIQIPYGKRMTTEPIDDCGIRGKVQEEELDSCRAAGERRPVAG